jgi:alkylhydroperoxidase family enzyme
MSNPTTGGTKMTSTTRIPKAAIPETEAAALLMGGELPEPAEVMWHNPVVLNSMMGFGAELQTWDQLDEGLKAFAHMAVASLVGCTWCLDLNYFYAHFSGIDEVKASEVPRWRESQVFTPLERHVMDYAEAMSATPPRVTDDLSARLLEQLGAPALVELTAVVGFANLTTRCNTALGIESQGFSKVCALPLAQPSARYATSA